MVVGLAFFLWQRPQTRASVASLSSLTCALRDKACPSTSHTNVLAGALRAVGVLSDSLLGALSDFFWRLNLSY